MYPRESGYCGYRGYPAQNTAWGLFHMRIMLTDFSIIGAHIQRLFAPSVSSFCLPIRGFSLLTPGALISRKFTREGGAVDWNSTTGI